MRWTEAQYQEYLMKLRKHSLPPLIHRPSELIECDEADPGPETDLAGKIQKWAKEMGFPCWCRRKSKKAEGFSVPGWPD